MIVPNFVGPSYTGLSTDGDVQRSVNIYPENIESGAGKNKSILYGRMGLKLFCKLSDAPLRAFYAQDGRFFAVAGGTFVEIDIAGNTIFSQAVMKAGTMATICSNGSGGQQLFITSGGLGYIFSLVTNTLVQITAAAFPAQVRMGIFLDGYFIALQEASNQFWISALEDGLSWSGLDTAQRETGSDQIQAIITDHRELWLFGSLTTEVWFNSGSASFPFQPIPGSFIERGAFTWSVSRLDNALFFLMQDRLGQGSAFRSNGYVPIRVSTHAVEYQWSQYATIADAESFTFHFQGHGFYVLNFPTAQKTWVFDVATNLWHEEDWFNAQTGLFECIRSRVYAISWGLMFVGDRENGNVYTQSVNYYDDNGLPIRKRRRFPHLSQEQLWQFFVELQVDLEVGAGIAGSAVAPVVIIRWSDDGGKTWSNDYTASLGLIGQYGVRAKWNRLGRARDRVFEVEVDDAVKLAMVNAYMTVKQGTS